jgi:hypothetical protein
MIQINSVIKGKHEHVEKMIQKFKEHHSFININDNAIAPLE